MKFILLTLFLYYIRLTSVEVAGDGRPTSNCCLTVTNTKVPIKNLLDYDLQNKPLCPIKAIRFHTIKHKTICSDPEDDWAKIARIVLDQRLKLPLKPVEEHFVCNISTSTHSPTTTTPIKTTRQETETSTSTVTTVTSTVRTFKTKIRTTDTKPATVSTKSSQSPLTSTNPCTTQPKQSTKTSKTRDRVTTTAVLITSIKHRKTPPKSIQRKRGKSKKGLRKYQMKITNKDKSTRQV